MKSITIEQRFPSPLPHACTIEVDGLPVVIKQEASVYLGGVDDPDGRFTITVNGKQVFGDDRDGRREYFFPEEGVWVRRYRTQNGAEFRVSASKPFDSFEEHEEYAAFTLRGRNYNDRDYSLWEYVPVSWEELKTAHVGTRWDAMYLGRVSRGTHNEYATLIYRDEKGCAVVLVRYGIRDDGLDWVETELHWFSFIP